MARTKAVPPKPSPARPPARRSRAGAGHVPASRDPGRTHGSAARGAIIARLHRVAGQVNGVARMLADDRYCIDVLTQMQAVKAALSKVEDAILADHAEHCVSAAIRSGDPGAQTAKFRELVELFGKFKR